MGGGAGGGADCGGSWDHLVQRRRLARPRDRRVVERSDGARSIRSVWLVPSVGLRLLRSVRLRAVLVFRVSSPVLGWLLPPSLVLPGTLRLSIVVRRMASS